MKKLILFLAALPLLAQVGPVAYRVDPPPVTTTSGTVPVGGFPALYAVAGANVYLYTDSTLATLATTYMDTTGTNACPTFAQITEPGTACTATTTVLGNFGWWLKPGNYFYKVTFGGKSYGPFPITTSTPGVGTLTGSGTPNFPAMWLTSTSLTTATYQSIFNLFSGCAGTDYPGFDGACHAIINPISTYTSPGTGGVSILINTDLINLPQSVVSFGAYCDGVINGSTGAVTGHDDSAALQAAFNALGSKGLRELTLPAPGLPSGPTGTGMTTGICLTSTQLTIGNGTSSTSSTQNGFTIKGNGGRQQWVNTFPNGSANFVVTAPGTGNYIPWAAGSSIIVYTGSYLTTSPFLTVAGPIYQVHLEGFALDVRNNAQTGIFFSNIEASTVKDLYVMNNYSATNIWNAGFWVSSYSSTFSDNPLYSGTQNNIFDGFGAMSLAATPTGIMIGCYDNTQSFCTPRSASGDDVSLNSFRNPAAIYYGSIQAIGMAIGYADSNTFQAGDLVAQNNLYLLYQTGGASGFPAANEWLDFHQEVPGAFMGTKTVGANIGYSDASVTLGSTYTLPPVTPAVVQIDQEVMIATSCTGVTTYTCAVTRGVAGIQSSHTSGTGYELNGYFIDSNGAMPTPATNFQNVMYFSPLTNFGGYPINSDYNSMINTNVVGVAGFNQNGQHFNTGYSAADNPFVQKLYSFGNTILASSATSNPAYFTPNWTIPDCQIGIFSCGDMNGAEIHMTGKIDWTNTSGGTVYIYPTFSITDSSGVVTFKDGRGFPMVTGISNAVVDFDVTISVEYITPDTPANIRATYDVKGRWLFDDFSNTVGGAQPTGAGCPCAMIHAVGQGGGSTGHFPLGGTQIAMGVQFNTSTASAQAILTDWAIHVNNPSKNGLQQ